MKDFQKAALAYAKLVKLLPMHGVTAKLKCTCGNASCDAPGKHPRVNGGVHAATNDPKQIRAWWTKWPDANIGMATGKASGIDVVDIDPRNGGTKTLAALVKKLGPLPKTAKTRTGGRGFHFLVKHLPFPVKKGILGPGIDYLTDGAIAILPPSHHHTGGVYQHVKHHNLLKGIKPKRLPKLWCDRLKKGKLSAPPAPQAVIVRGAGAIETSANTREIARNNALTSFAGSLVRAGCTGQALVAALQAYNTEHFDPPLEADEVQKVADSVGRYAVGDPNQERNQREYRIMDAFFDQIASEQRHLMYLQGHGWYEYNGKYWSAVSQKTIEKQVLRHVEQLPSDVRGKATAAVSDVMQLMAIKLTPDVPDPIHEQPPRAVINCRNGELWFCEGAVELRPHSPESYLTNMLNVDYDPIRKAPPL